MKEADFIERGGVNLPRVSYILKTMGVVNTRWYKESGANRGTDVHILTGLVDSELLESEDVPDGLKGYIEAYIRFRKDNEVKILESEKEVIYKDYYIGHLDRVIELNGDVYLIDIKTGGFEKWHGLQLAAYGLAYDVRLERAVLQLKKDGKYTFKTKYKGDSLGSNLWLDGWLCLLKRFYLRKGVKLDI